MSDDMATVSLSDDYYTHESWTDHTDGKITIYDYHDVYEIPIEQRDRWQAAMDAYEDMQAEIRELMEARREKLIQEQARSERNAATWKRPGSDRHDRCTFNPAGFWMHVQPGCPHYGGRR